MDRLAPPLPHQLLRAVPDPGAHQGAACVYREFAAIWTASGLFRSGHQGQSPWATAQLFQRRLRTPALRHRSLITLHTRSPIPNRQPSSSPVSHLTSAQGPKPRRSRARSRARPRIRPWRESLLAYSRASISISSCLRLRGWRVGRISELQAILEGRSEREGRYTGCFTCLLKRLRRDQSDFSDVGWLGA